MPGPLLPIALTLLTSTAKLRTGIAVVATTTGIVNELISSAQKSNAEEKNKEIEDELRVIRDHLGLKKEGSEKIVAVKRQYTKYEGHHYQSKAEMLVEAFKGGVAWVDAKSNNEYYHPDKKFEPHDAIYKIYYAPNTIAGTRREYKK